MAVRKWFVRSVVFALAALMAVCLFVYRSWTDPVAVREQVLLRLRQHLPGADVTLESARFSLFGGITFGDLRLMEKGDLESSPTRRAARSTTKRINWPMVS